MRASLAAVILLLSPSLATAQPNHSNGAGSKHFDLADLAKLVRLSEPRIRPDGKSIVLVVSRPNYEKDRHESELVLIDIASGSQRVLTHDREDVSQPRWSPAGDRLAFLAKVGTGKDAKPQVFALPMDGGEALRVTNSPTGVQHYAWKPDGTAIAYAAADEPPNKKDMEKGEDGFEIGDDSVLTTAAPQPSHVWLVPSTGGTAKRLTSGSWSLPVTPPPGSPASPLSWSPDGKSIALVKQASPHFGDADERTIQILDVATGKLRPLTGAPRFEGHPTFSPDGTNVAYWQPRDADPTNVNEIWVAPAAGGPGRCLTRDIDRCLYQSLWTPDGKALLVGGNDGTRVSLWLQPLDGPARRLDLGAVTPAWSFYVDATIGKDGAIAFVASEPHRPPELYDMTSPEAPPRRLTDFHHEVASMHLGDVGTIAWDTDGFRADGVVVYPPGFSAGTKYPLVLLVHGGPRAASTEAFSALPQLIAGRGYVVFQPNYRGSDNLGNTYQHAIVKDSGAGPGRDVMAGVEALKAKGFINPDRIAVSGWSYGGYMTTWLLGNYPGWTCAVAGAAVTDLMDQYNLSDSNVNRRYTMGGSPWLNGNEKLYREQSPISYATKVRTPTLILSDTGDARVPIANSFRFYHALKDNGVPVKFLAWPISGHSPADPVRSRAVYREWLAWLDKHMK